MSLQKRLVMKKIKAIVLEIHINEMSVPVDYDTICLHQRDDIELKESCIYQKTRENYKSTNYGQKTLWTKKGEDEQYRIWLPTTLRPDLLKWYHGTLQYPGSRILKESVRANFTCLGLSKLYKEITSTCETCSEIKLIHVMKDGKLPLRDDKIIKHWELLSVDLYGP